MSGAGAVFLAQRGAALVDVALVLVVVAVETEQLPVAAIGRVVIVVVVLVMDRELVQVGLRKLPCTAATDPRKQLQGLGAVPLLTLVPRTARVGDDAIEPAEVGGHTFARRHAAIVIRQERIGKVIFPNDCGGTLTFTGFAVRLNGVDLGRGATRIAPGSQCQGGRTHGYQHQH